MFDEDRLRDTALNELLKVSHNVCLTKQLLCFIRVTDVRKMPLYILLHLFNQKKPLLLFLVYFFHFLRGSRLIGIIRLLLLFGEFVNGLRVRVRGQIVFSFSCLV